MVVYLHANITMDLKNIVQFIQQVISQEVTRVAVPLFFLMSGVLFFRNIKTFNRSLFLSKICRRVHSLFIPYIIFSVFGFLFVYATQLFIPMQSYQVGKFTIEKFLYILLIHPIGCYQLWFIRDLFILSLLSPCIYWGIKRFKECLILSLFVLWILGIQYIITSESIFYFVLGAYLGCYKMSYLVSKHHNSWFTTIITIMWLILDFSRVYYQLSYFFHCLGILVGIYCIWILYDLLYDKIEKYIMHPILSYTFFIYLMHEPLLTIMKKILLITLGTSSLSIFFIYLIAPIITIKLCIIGGRLLKNKYNNIYIIITGGR